MNRNPTLPVLALGAAAAALALLGLINLSTGWSLGRPPWGLGLAAGYDAAAYRLISRPAPTAAQLDRAEQLTRQALALSPYESTGWLRLASIDAARHGALTDVGARDFEKSYALMPIDPSVAAWRIKFGLEHWSELTPDTRLAVEAESETFLRLGAREVNVQEIYATIEDPSGRLAIALWQGARRKR